MTIFPSRQAGAPSRHHRQPCPWLFALILLLLAEGAGCSSTPARPVPAGPPAVIVVENHTDYAWRVAFDSPDPRESSDPEAAGGWLGISPRATRRVELAGGVYRVRRQLVAGTGMTPDTGIELTFAPGHTYMWPLGTLFSSGGAAP